MSRDWSVGGSGRVRRAVGVLLAGALALVGLGAAVAPAQAAVSTTSTMVGTLANVTWTRGLTEIPTSAPKLLLTSTTDAARTWSLTLTPDTMALPTGTVAFDPRHLDAGGTLLTVASATSSTGLSYLPNDTYSVVMSFPTAAGTKTSPASTLSTAVFSAPATITSPVAGSTVTGSSVPLDLTFPQVPALGSVLATFTGQGACASDVVTYAPSPLATLTTHLTATLGLAGSLVSSLVPATQTGSFTRGCTYDLSVAWTNLLGYPGYPGVSALASGIVVPDVPGKPSGLGLTPGDGEALVSWVAPSTGGLPISGYLATAQPGGQTCATLGTSCTIPGLTNGTSYDVVVAATNAVGTGLASAATTVVPRGVPGVPTSVNGQQGDHEVAVDWGPAPWNGSVVTSYLATAIPSGKTCTAPGTATTCTITGLQDGVDQAVTVVATNAVGAGLPGTWSFPALPGAPAAPTGVVATAGDQAASVVWSAASGADGYTAVAMPGGQSCTTTGATACTITGLTNGTSYVVAVLGSNSVGTGLSSLLSGAVVPAGLPGAPSDVTGAAGNASALVSWAAADPNGSAIQQYVATASPGGLSCTTTGTSCTIPGLDNGTAYTFVVKAVNALGDALSPASGAVTPGALPDPVSGVAALAGSHAVDVSWLPPLSLGGLSLLNYVATAMPGGASCTTTSQACQITGLTNGVTYQINVVARTLLGSSLPVYAQSPVKPAGAPSSPSFTSVTPGAGTAQLGWSAPDDGGSPITRYTVTSSPTSAGCTTTAQSCTVKGLPGGRYTLRLTATNAYGTSAPATLVITIPANSYGLAAKVASTAKRGKGKKSVALVVTANRASTFAVSLNRGVLTAKRTLAVKRGTNAVTVLLPKKVRKLANGKPFTVTVRGPGNKLLTVAQVRAKK